jgi:hypothetical protein
LIYSKRGSSCGKPITGNKLISYTVAYLTIPLLIINNRDVIDFPVVFLIALLLSSLRKNKREIRSIKNGIFFILFVWNKPKFIEVIPILDSNYYEN